MDEQASVLMLDHDVRAQLWTRIIESVEHYFNEVPNHRVLADLSKEKVRALIGKEDFTRPVDPLEAVELCLKGLWQFQTHTAHPRYFGLFDPAPTTMAIAAEMLVATFNPQLAAWKQSPFAVEVEQHLLRMFGEKFGYTRDEVDGTFTSGGAEANHTAVLAALAHTFPSFDEKGLGAVSASPVLYLSSEAHHSLFKAARFCGLGTNAVRVIPVDPQLRMDVRRLEHQISEDRLAGLTPLMLVATVGTTNAGAVDPIEDLAEIAWQEKIWLHADAAWGGAMVLVPEFRSLLKGIEQADSITFDPHKLLSPSRRGNVFDSTQALTPSHRSRFARLHAKSACSGSGDG